MEYMNRGTLELKMKQEVKMNMEFFILEEVHLLVFTQEAFKKLTILFHILVAFFRFNFLLPFN